MFRKTVMCSLLIALLCGSAARAEEVRAGDPVTTEGLVCDTPSEVETVATLMYYGYPEEAALGAVNDGKQRCVAGMLSFGRYVREISIFSLGSEHIAVQEIELLAVAPLGKATKLPQPLRQFVVSVKKLKGA